MFQSRNMEYLYICLCRLSFFSSVSYSFLVYRSFASLDRFIPRYFNPFWFNGEWDYLLYWNAKDFCGEKKRKKVIKVSPFYYTWGELHAFWNCPCASSWLIYIYKDPFSLIVRVIPEFHDGVSIILCFQNKLKLGNQLSLDASSVWIILSKSLVSKSVSQFVKLEWQLKLPHWATMKVKKLTW